MPWTKRALCVLAIASSTGCVSSGTWRAWHVEAERIDAEERLAEPGHDAASAWTPLSSCELIAEAAIARSPSLSAPRERARAALASARSEGALPPPSVRASVWDFPIGDPSRADREGMYMLGVAQEFPPEAALDAGARRYVAMARESLATLDEIRREVRSEAGHACADWASAALRVEALEAWAALLEAASNLAEVRFGAGGEMLADVARIERERASAERARRRALSDGARAATTLRALLDLPDEVELGSPPDLSGDAADLEADELVEVALRARGVLEAARVAVDVSLAAADGADAAANVPTFMFGATYMQTPNARPGVMLEIGMTLPWLSGGASDAAAASRAEVAAAEADVTAIERRIRIDVRTALAELQTAETTLAVLRDTEAPATRRALDVVQAVYAAGGGTLIDWLDTARAVRELELEEAELIGEVAHRLVDVASAVGSPIPSGSSGDDLAAPDPERAAVDDGGVR